MSGGFVEEPRREKDEPDTRSREAPNGNGSGQSDLPLLALTPRQETRLRSHLDDRLLSLERDERKHAFTSIPFLLDRLFPLLHLILQIPPKAPWADLRISYLLTFTGYIATYITSLPLLPGRIRAGSEAAIRAAGQVMLDVLAFLAEVEKGWMAVFRGDGWVVDEEDDGIKSEGGKRLRRKGHGVPVDFGGSINQTERTRLRSIVIASRAKFVAWARSYGTFPGRSLPGDPNGAPATPSAHGTADHPYNDEEARTTGCDGAFDPDPPTAYPTMLPSSLEDGTSHFGHTGDWEDRILGMWNDILETLSEEEHRVSGR